MKKIYALALSVVSCASVFATQVKVGDNLQTALDTAKAGETLYVQEGTFVGNFTMRNGVNVSGGWNEDFTTQKQYGTVLDGDAKGRVLTQTADFTQETVYDNLTIQNGCLQENGKGAGVCLLWKSKLTNCLVQNNTFAEGVTNCEGGGLAQDKDDNAGDIVADNCVFRNNKATHGGGVWLRSTITNCVIENNETLQKHPGGGAHLQWGRMYNCVIRNNHSTEDAGGVRAYGNCKLVNCLIAGNTCDVKVAGLALERTLSEVINCTIVDNAQTLETTDQEYCGVRCDASNAGSNVFVNNVIWGNRAGDKVWNQQISWNLTKYGTCEGNAIQGKVPGDVKALQLGENMEANGPHFANPEKGDYTLLMSSVLLDKGVKQDDGKYVVKSDLAGKARVQGLSVEPGAYELATMNVRANTADAAAAGKALQDAVDAAAAGTVVFVEAGTYQGNFTMREGVIVSGGWNSDFTEQTDYASVLDANANGRVLNQSADFATLTVWENFTIQNGKLTAKAADNLGAGVVVRKQGRIANCLVQNNTYTYTSGNCMGGGLGHESGNRNDTCAVNCVFRNNLSTHGGGARVRGVVVGCTFEKNTSKNGGGLYLQAGAAYNCVVRGNSSTGNAGGVDAFGTCVLANCVIANNVAEGTVGGLSVRSGNRETADSGSDVINCTIVGNNQKSTSNLQFCAARLDVRNNPNHIFVNNVIWGNTANGEVQATQLGGYPQGYGVRTNNAFQGTININAEYISLGENEAVNGPQFVDPANGNYAFAWSSPLYNAGLNSAMEKMAGDKDIMGNARMQGENIDLGAVEHKVFTATIAPIENGTLVLDYGVKDTLAAGTRYVPEGLAAAILATPAAEYQLDAILLNGSKVEPKDGIYMLPAVTADFTLAVTFKSIPTSVADTREAEVVLSVYDMLGNQIATDVENLGAGMYIVVTNHGAKKISIR